MNRRNFIHITGLSLGSILISTSLFSFADSTSGFLLSFPGKVSAVVNGQYIGLTGRDQQSWTNKNATVNLRNTGNSMVVEIHAPGVSLSEGTLRWHVPAATRSAILNDHWERTYGDISWHKASGPEKLPCYFMEYNNQNTNGFGVKTAALSFCCWKVGNRALSLTLDTRSGGNGVKLGNRKLQATEIVTLKSGSDKTPFQAARMFTTVMCDKARMPKQPVYGINDWYFSYGNNSEKLILEHTEMMEPMAEGLGNRPFSIIDAGWFQNPPSMPNYCYWGDTMDTPGEGFGDMGILAAKIRSNGMRSGIWTRPLCGSYKDTKSLMLPLIKGREENKSILDPTIAENRERVKTYLRLYNDWSYELVKFDFTTFDIFGKWGFEMMQAPEGWCMNDNTTTNAEIILNLYKSTREAAGESYLIGCNTFSHLSAGLFELNRIGYDTSGNEWDRTRKMGVNTLAFRGLHHGTFYAADGDCVGLTNKVPCEKNKQWMELLAKSGTQLFISAQPDATGTKQKAFIKECFNLASQNLPVAEPLDWMENAFPKKWKLNRKIETLNWD